VAIQSPLYRSVTAAKTNAKADKTGRRHRDLGNCSVMDPAYCKSKRNFAATALGPKATFGLSPARFRACRVAVFQPSSGFSSIPTEQFGFGQIHAGLFNRNQKTGVWLQL
jgi:hypothetical protein